MFKTFLTIRAVPFSSESLKIFLAAFLGFIVLSLVLRLIGIKLSLLLRKRLFKLSNFCLTIAITGFIFLFFNYERASVIGSRIWFLIGGVGFLVWLGFILYDIIVRLPREKKALSEKEKFEKYLPK
jgi:FtsH-binding integral membrane protein